MIEQSYDIPIAMQHRFLAELERLKTRMTTHALWNDDPALVAITLLTEMQDELMASEHQQKIWSYKENNKPVARNGRGK